MFYEWNIYDEMYKINIFPGNLSGYADFTQSDPRPIKNKEDKVECLVKIDSNLRHDITIGDSGILFSLLNMKLLNLLMKKILKQEILKMQLSIGIAVK